MGINRTKLLLERRPAQELKRTQRELLNLKTRQLLGGDNMVYDATPATTVALLGATAGSQSLLNLLIDPSLDKLMIAEVAWELFIGVDGNYANAWPDGVSLSTTEQFDVDASLRRRLKGANNATGDYEYLFRVVNNTAATKNFYFRFQLIFQKVSLS